MWQRISASIKKRGLIKTVFLVPQKTYVYLSKLGDRVFDVRHGTDTFEIVELETLHITSANKERGIRYEPTRARAFFSMMTTLDLPLDSGFVDFGCGKGRVLLMAMECGFSKVTGVDFSAELCDVAGKNVAAYQSKHGTRADVGVYNVDAVDYRVRDDDAVFYFFNPFDETVLSRVMDNIAASLAAVPRHAWIIYHNPLWRHVIERWSMFKKSATYHHAECKFVVFTNKE